MTTTITSQSGPQTQFLSCPADIAIYGGAAGGGKSYALLLEPLHYHNIRGFSAICFRRTYPEIRQLGGLWDTANELYRPLGVQVSDGHLSFKFPRGMKVQFSHLQYEDDIYSWQGAQIPLIMFDELTHFTAKQFWYMLSRNRSTCGVKPYIRGTCNPDPGSWIFELIQWWIGPDGIPIKERSGIIRYFIRNGEKIIWADRKEDLPEEINGSPASPKSFTFIGAKLEDNPALAVGDPAYRSNLMALPYYERQLLLDGNWLVKPEAGSRFKKVWFEIVEQAPCGGRTIRYWDRASTKPSETNKDPDWTRGVQMTKAPNGITYIMDVASVRNTPLHVEGLIANCASQDTNTELWLEQDPAQAGEVERSSLSLSLEKYAPRWIKPTGSKYVRSAPVSAAAEVGNVKLVRGKWNKDYLDEMEQFCDQDVVKVPAGYHDEQADATSGGFNILTNGGGPPRIR